MNHYYFKKTLKNFPNRIKSTPRIDFQKIIIHSSFIAILIIATTTIAIADESTLTQSFSNSDMGLKSTFVPNGHMEDFSWIKKVSIDGVIEISGIKFSMVNDDDVPHSFEICSIVQGPLEIFTPDLDNPLACTNTDKIENNVKIDNLSINFPKGVKVSDLVDISISIQESD